MNSTAISIQNVLRRMADESAVAVHATDQFPLSPLFSGSFDIYCAEVLGSRVLFAEAIAEAGESSKLLEAMEAAIGEPIALYLDSATAPQRRSLMLARRGFISGQGDMYLPQLALALTAAVSKKPEIRQFTTPQKQAFLYCLFGTEPLTQKCFQELVGISAAGASRALSSLSDLRLIDYEIGGKTGRKREYFVPDMKELYRRGKKLFGDPIKSVGIVNVPDGATALASGLSALSMRSELQAPANKVIAVGPHALLEDGFEAGSPDGVCILQRLVYDPVPFASDGMVDPFTMLMTIGEDDERISIALREALREYAWYTD